MNPINEEQRFLFVYGWTTFNLLLIWTVYRVLSGRWSIAGIFEGADGRPSTSKFQFLLWTGVVLFGYLAVYLARVSQGAYAAVDGIPANLLIAMGFTGVTAAAAKGITTGFVNSGQLQKSEASPAPPPGGAPPPLNPVKKRAGMSSIVTDDEGFPDLSKIQMMAWTLIAIGVYGHILIVHVNGIISLKAFEGAAEGVGPLLKHLTPTQLSAAKDAWKINLPDVSPALMVLMGLGQGAYLGKKLVTTDTPRLTGLAPPAGRPGAEVTITGQAVGEPGSATVVTIDGEPMPTPAVVTSGQAGGLSPNLKFRFPEKRPSGADWQAGAVSIGLLIAGQESANRLPFTVILRPIIDQVFPTSGKVGTEITISGQGIAGSAQAPLVLVDAAEVAATSFTGNEVKFKLPAVPAGVSVVQIGLKVEGHESANRRPVSITV